MESVGLVLHIKYIPSYPTYSLNCSELDMEDHIKFLKKESECVIGHYKVVAQQDIEHLVQISTCFESYCAKCVQYRESKPSIYVLLDAASGITSESDDDQQMEGDEALVEGESGKALGLGQGIDDLDFGASGSQTLGEIFRDYKKKRS
jgi:hypothetical protein